MINGLFILFLLWNTFVNYNSYGVISSSTGLILYNYKTIKNSFLLLYFINTFNYYLIIVTTFFHGLINRLFNYKNRTFIKTVTFENSKEVDNFLNRL